MGGLSGTRAELRFRVYEGRCGGCGVVRGQRPADETPPVCCPLCGGKMRLGWLVVGKAACEVPYTAVPVAGKGGKPLHLLTAGEAEATLRAWQAALAAKPWLEWLGDRIHDQGTIVVESPAPRPAVRTTPHTDKRLAGNA